MTTLSLYKHIVEHLWQAISITATLVEPNIFIAPFWVISPISQFPLNAESWQLLRVKEQRNILHEISKRKANWIGHILRRMCLLQRFIEGKIKEGVEVIGRQGRRRRKLLDDLKEIRGYSHLNEEALDRTM
jgi:hypothetical protein